MRCWVKGYEVPCKVKTASMDVKTASMDDKTVSMDDKSKAMILVFQNLRNGKGKQIKASCPL